MGRVPRMFRRPPRSPTAGEDLGEGSVQGSLGLLEHLRARAFEIQPAEEVRARALRVLSLHKLRVSGAWELAAALIWCRERTQKADFVSVDGPLRLAAVLEGFRVFPYADEVHEPEPDL